MDAHQHHKKIGTLVISAVAATAMANAAVYIAPADIDTYKQKSDQAFHDLYQNQDSVVAEGASAPLKDMAANVETGQKLYTGHTLTRVVQSTINGEAIPAGLQASFALSGNGWVKHYGIKTDPDTAKILIFGPGAQGGVVALKDQNAVEKTGAWCSNDGKYGCERYTRNAKNVYLDAPSGIVTVASIQQSLNRHCGKHGCSTTSNWHDSGMLSMDKKPIDIASILRQEQDRIDIRTMGRQIELRYNPNAMQYDSGHTGGSSGGNPGGKFG